MAATIKIPAHVKLIGGGGTITYKGNADKCIWWELVGVSAMVEGAAYGSLDNIQHITDADGYATAVYTAPTTDPGAGNYDRIKVHEEQAV